ncbi:MAG: type IV pilus assembly protein PilM [Deltaproteobacteria bacterium]|nr:type IV pilus assembly protein PilM [Deltaproteobacteria bacterium]
MKLSKKKPIIGLDIGTHTIKMAEVVSTKSGYRLTGIGMARIPPDALVEGQIQNPEILVRTIKSLFHNLKFKVKNIATSISGYSVVVKKINVPRMAEDALAENIRFEAEQYIPFDINEVNIDFQILEQPKEEGMVDVSFDRMEVILVAAKNDIINEYVELIDKAKLTPSVVDVDAFALENVYDTNYDYDEEAAVALVDIGASQININIVQGGLSIFTRDAPTGGNQITLEIAREFGVDYEEAEQMKLGYNLDKNKLIALEDIFIAAATAWSREIKQAVDFVSGSLRGGKINRLVLSGGSSMIPGFAQYMARESGIPVEHIDPFAKLSFDSRKIDAEYLKAIAPQAAIVIGLALRRVGDK